METKQLLKDALAELMAVDGLYDVPVIKERVILARANLRKVIERMGGVSTGKVLALREGLEVAHG